MENIVKTEQLYEGKAKKVFATNDPDLVIVDYKDDATAFNGEKNESSLGFVTSTSQLRIRRFVQYTASKIFSCQKPWIPMTSLLRRSRSFRWKLS